MATNKYRPRSVQAQPRVEPNGSSSKGFYQQNKGDISEFANAFMQIHAGQKEPTPVAPVISSGYGMTPEQVAQLMSINQQAYATKSAAVSRHNEGADRRVFNLRQVQRDRRREKQAGLDRYKAQQYSQWQDEQRAMNRELDIEREQTRYEAGVEAKAVTEETRVEENKQKAAASLRRDEKLATARVDAAQKIADARLNGGDSLAEAIAKYKVFGGSTDPVYEAAGIDPPPPLTEEQKKMNVIIGQTSSVAGVEPKLIEQPDAVKDYVEAPAKRANAIREFNEAEEKKDQQLKAEETERKDTETLKTEGRKMWGAVYTGTKKETTGDDAVAQSVAAANEAEAAYMNAHRSNQPPARMQERPGYQRVQKDGVWGYRPKQ